FREGDGSDVVSDFTLGEDWLGLAEGIDFNELTITGNNNSAVINKDGKNLATLTGINFELITESTFMVM
ncbi:hypothetical protein, partial [Phormidium sp. CCY1219]|uniref:hypothetical protein n=1 Tax=Phormidium sp. CCY1219 TaxID=2886104 RepID=UPI002D1ECA24